MEVFPGGIAVAECERRPGRPEQCARAPQRILAALGQGEPPLERHVVASERRRERADLVVQRQPRLIRGTGLIGDHREQRQALFTQQRPLRRAHQSRRKVHARQAGGVPVAQRLAQAPDIVARDLREPVADAPVNVDRLLLGNLAGRRRPDQIVRQPEHRSRSDGDATRDELTHRVLGAPRAPAVQAGDVRQRKRPRGDGEERDERSRVSTGAA